MIPFSPGKINLFLHGKIFIFFLPLSWYNSTYIFQKGDFEMAVHKNGIIVIGAVFVDIKGFPDDVYIPDGRNAGRVEYVHGGVSRNVVEDIANIELRPHS